MSIAKEDVKQLQEEFGVEVSEETMYPGHCNILK